MLVKIGAPQLSMSHRIGKTSLGIDLKLHTQSMNELARFGSSGGGCVGGRVGGRVGR